MSAVRPYYDNPLSFCFKSNEQGEIDIIEDLKDSQIIQNFGTDTSYYLGVSGLQNENYLEAIASRLSKGHNFRAVLLDIDGHVGQLHNAVRKEAKKVWDVDKFAYSMGKFALGSDACRRTFLQRDIYWLQTEERFLTVRKFFSEDRVLILHRNLANPTTGDLLQALSGKVSVLYVSNVPEWLQEDEKALSSLDQNLSRLAAPNARIIQSRTVHGRGLSLSISQYVAGVSIFSSPDPHTLQGRSISTLEYTARERHSTSSWDSSLEAEYLPDWY